MRRCIAGAMLVLLLAGCGEDAQQQGAREAVQVHVTSLGAGSGYDAGDAHCTKAAGIWFGNLETSSFICAVRREEGGCDWFDVAVDRERRAVHVDLRERAAGCVLPA